MRVPVAIAVIAVSVGCATAVADPHRYTRAERYAGCLFGETVPLMRRGTDREHALSTAAKRCVAWSEGLSTGDVRAVDFELHRALDRFERQGF